MDELDEYICPNCGYSNEACMCDFNAYEYDEWGEHNEWEEQNLPHDDKDDIVCYLNGEPLYKGMLEL